MEALLYSLLLLIMSLAWTSSFPAFKNEIHCILSGLFRSVPDFLKDTATRSG